MPDLWYPPAARDALGMPGAGPFTGGRPKIVLHTTEGHRYSDAANIYAARRYWPTGTLTFENGRPEAHQHLPYNVAAEALEHPPGTGETNTDNVVQLELVGSADRTLAARLGLLWVGDFPAAYLEAIGAWVAHIAAATGAPLAAPYPFDPAPRLTWPDWHNAAGVLGHSHVPNNTHVDPGPIPIGPILAAARGANPPMPPEQANYVRHVHRHAGGTWRLATDGGVFADGGAPFYGSLGGMRLNAPAVALVATATELGYWIVTADGGIFAGVDGVPFGDAPGIAPYRPLVNEYALGARRVVDAVACPLAPNALDLLSNLGEEYHLQ